MLSLGRFGTVEEGELKARPTRVEEYPMIVVAGEALIDMIPSAEGLLSPVPGGSSYNTARAIGRLGVSVEWMGGLSDDGFGRLLEARLRDDGVGVGLASRTLLPTTLAIADIDAHGDASYSFYTEATSATVLDAAHAIAGAREADAVLVGSIALVLEPIGTALEMMAAALNPLTLLMIDPNARPSMIPNRESWSSRIDRLFHRADVVKASVEDLDCLKPGEASDDVAKGILAVGPRLVIVTDGVRGSTAHGPWGAIHVEASTVAVSDTVGAGDAFAGAFVAAITRLDDPREALADPDSVRRAVVFASSTAADTCTRLGADPPTLRALGGWPFNNAGPRGRSQGSGGRHGSESGEKPRREASRAQRRLAGQ